MDEKVPTVELVKNAVDSKLGKFTKSDMMELVPSVVKLQLKICLNN